MIYKSVKMTATEMYGTRLNYNENFTELISLILFAIIFINLHLWFS